MRTRAHEVQPELQQVPQAASPLHVKLICANFCLNEPLIGLASVMLADVFLLAVLTALTTYLFASVTRRLLRREVGRLAQQNRETPSVFDASTIRPRIEQVREDYVRELHSRPGTSSFRQQLIASTRRTLCRLAFFRERGLEQDETRFT